MLFDTYPTRRQVLVYLKSGTTLEGILWQKKGAYLVLKEARAKLKGTGIVSVGEAMVYREQVDFIQVLGVGGAEV